MTWWSTSSRKLREAREHGGVPNAPAVIKPNDTNGGFTWFFDAASKLKLKSKKESSNVDVGDPEEDTDVTKDTPKSADEEVNDILLKNPKMAAATLVNTMKSKGLVVSKVTEAWSKFVERASEGGPGSGPRPGQHGKAKDTKHPYGKVTVLDKTPKSFGKIIRIQQRYAEHLKAAEAKAIEADSSSAFTQVTRESARLPTKLNLRPSNLREADRDNLGEVDTGHKLFDVQLIQEGMGNFGDAYYYHRDALESAISLFEGLKIYADHPSASEEQDRPERSTRDILGHYEELLVEGDEKTGAVLRGKVDILSSEKWAIARMQRAIENAQKFPDKDFVGLSINATGDADETPIDEVISWAPESAKPKLLEAKANGIDSVKVVRKLNSATSCDFVTEAGAGGKILNIIEGE